MEFSSRNCREISSSVFGHTTLLLLFIKILRIFFAECFILFYRLLHRLPQNSLIKQVQWAITGWIRLGGILVENPSPVLINPDWVTGQPFHGCLAPIFYPPPRPHHAIRPRFTHFALRVLKKCLLVGHMVDTREWNTERIIRTQVVMGIQGIK